MVFVCRLLEQPGYYDAIIIVIYFVFSSFNADPNTQREKQNQKMTLCDWGVFFWLWFLVKLFGKMQLTHVDFVNFAWLVTCMKKNK